MVIVRLVLVPIATTTTVRPVPKPVAVAAGKAGVDRPIAVVEDVAIGDGANGDEVLAALSPTPMKN